MEPLPATPAGRRLPSPPVVPFALPLIGHALAFLADPLGFLMRAAATGPIATIRLGPIDAYLVREPADIERVLVTDNRRFIKDRATRQLGRVLGQGLLTSEGDTWLRRRRLAQPAFHRERIAAYATGMVEAAERAAAIMRSGEERDLHADLMRLTLDIVARALFDAEVAEVEGTVQRSVEGLMARFGNGIFALFPALERLPLPQNARFDEALSALDDIILRIIRERRARGGGDDLLGMFLQARDEDGAGLDDRELRDEVMTLFLAGHETTALALTYAFLLLSRHPDAEARLRAEITATLGERPATAEDLARLPYAHAVVLEAMRIYPPVWALGREATEELTLAGHHIPRGGQVWLAQWVNHRDPRYFDDPERFRPERWLDGLERRLPRFAYYPFGGGPRLCIGNAFATLEAVLLLVTLMRRLHIRVRLDRRLELVPTVTLRPRDPVIAHFKRV